MKRIKIKLDTLYCDLCSYEIKETFSPLKEVESIEVKRRENLLFLNLNKLINFNFLRKTLELEGYIVVDIEEVKNGL